MLKGIGLHPSMYLLAKIVHIMQITMLNKNSASAEVADRNVTWYVL